MNDTHHSIRHADINDLPRIVEIYNGVISEGNYTADLTTYDVAAKQSWFDTVSSDAYGIYVLEANNMVQGYGYLSPWRGGRQSLSGVAEISFYLCADVRGMGLGTHLIQHTIDHAKTKKFTHLLAILLDINKRSQYLLEKHGFVTAGHLPNIANLERTRSGQLIMLLSL